MFWKPPLEKLSTLLEIERPLSRDALLLLRMMFINEVIATDPWNYSASETQVNYDMYAETRGFSTKCDYWTNPDIEYDMFQNSTMVGVGPKAQLGLLV